MRVPTCAICRDEGLEGEVIEVGESRMARVLVPGGVQEVAVDLIEGEVRPGDRLLVHLGFALARMREMREEGQP